MRRAFQIIGAAALGLVSGLSIMRAHEKRTVDDLTQYFAVQIKRLDADDARKIKEVGDNAVKQMLDLQDYCLAKIRSLR